MFTKLKKREIKDPRKMVNPKIEYPILNFLILNLYYVIKYLFKLGFVIIMVMFSVIGSYRYYDK